LESEDPPRCRLGSPRLASQAILDSHRHVLVRAGRHVHLLKDLGWDVQECGDTVYL
jgi:hypothetical protein